MEKRPGQSQNAAASGTGQSKNASGSASRGQGGAHANPRTPPNQAKPSQRDRRETPKDGAAGTGRTNVGGQSRRGTGRGRGGAGRGSGTAERGQEPGRRNGGHGGRGRGARGRAGGYAGGGGGDNGGANRREGWRNQGNGMGERRGDYSVDRGAGRPEIRDNVEERRNRSKSQSVGKSEAPKGNGLGFKRLQELSTKEPSEVAISVSSHPALKTLLGESLMRPDLLELLCFVLSKAFRSRADRGSLLHLANLIKDSSFLRTVLPHYLAGIGSESNAARREKYPQQLENILTILTQVLSIFPASSLQPVNLLLTLLPIALNSLRTLGVDIPAQVEENMGHLQHLVTHLQTRSREGTLRSDKDTYALLPIGQGNPDADQEEGLQNFRTIPIYPTPEELRHEERPYLRPNLTSKSYPNTHIYLDTHFRLLREDFVRPLREGIQELLWNQMNIGRMDNPVNQVKGKRLDDIRMYHDTTIIAPKCTNNGLAYVVQFSVEPLKFVRWENSKRLIYGSLVCLSCDNFESFLFATVSDRDPRELRDGKVMIIFTEQSRHKLARVPQNQVFLMVETTAYFEAYRYVLEGLQEQEEDELPFQRYLVECSPDVQPPVYLQRSDTYDLASVAHPEFKKKVKPFHCLDTKAWPTMEELGLDESQFRAFQLALTKELAIIQGPPGTGKTYVGLKIAQALLTNQTLWRLNSPVLVVCYTNHALDQFLEGIHKFLPEGIVRVGSRSNSEILKRFNLRELAQRQKFRRNHSNHLSAAYNTIYRELCEAERRLQAQGMQLECSVKGVLRESILQKYISQKHWDSLHTVRTEDGFELVAGKKLSLIMEWLGLGGLHQGSANASFSQDMGPETAMELDEDIFIDIAEEAEIMAAERVIDDFIYSRDGKDRKRETELAIRELETLMLAASLDERETQPEANPGMSEDMWELQKNQKKNLKKKIKRELMKSSSMTEEEEELFANVWRLSLPDRWKLYRLWISRYRMELRTKTLDLEQEYQNSVDRLADVKRRQDCQILKEATVIGMTTTGAAKFRHTLQQVRPSLVIVEEAAEVLEAHTITTLSSACQHLILIGDHQQLRPSATVYELAKNFNLEMSMFERLVNMELPFIRLNYQHRMRPDIARLLTPHIYSELENHPTVLEYENIKGLNTNLFFVEHKHLEEEIKDGRSHQNKHEAQFVVALCQYLLHQEYKPEQITILTTYTGQLFCLRKLMPASQFSGVKVHVVDKYQGEENDIVLLSLVRSNLQRRVGFLNIPNRVCVALSRAKKGLYCIGNSEMLGQVKLWSNIFHTLREKDQIGTALTLCCQNHPSRQVKAASAADFGQAPEGGCTQPCEYRLDCGHVCTKVCHPYDPEHKEYKCLKKCPRLLCDLGHGCPLLCYQTCNECKVPVEKTIPQCQHKQIVPCHQDPATFVCQVPCPKTLECGHPCDTVCGKPCTMKCKVKIDFELKCGHSQKDFCFYKTQQKEPACVTPCKKQLKCDHVCPGKCSLCHSGRYHCDCSHQCDRLLVCSHKCRAPCTGCPPCELKCENRCVHSKCSKRCGQPCSPCVEPCAWQCPHQTCTKLCHEPCDRPPCNEPCDKVLPCKHPCIGLCGEKCPNKCRICDRQEVTEIFFGFEDDPEARFIQLQDCGHVIERRAMDQYMQMDQTQQENEEEVAIKLKECPKCRTPIRKNVRYGSHINRCLAEIELVKQKIAGKRKDIQTQAWALQKQWEGKKYCVCMTQLPEEFAAIVDKLMTRDLSAFDLWIVENKMNFFLQVAKLMVIGKEKMSPSDGMAFNEQINHFLGWLKDRRQRFTEQQLYDLDRELPRLTLLAELNAHCNAAGLRGERPNIQMEEDVLRNVFDKSGQFTEDDEAGIKQNLEEVKKKFPLTGLGISEKERKMIVSVINQPGHWFKCPNGHVYLIGDCGGATVSSKCPDCNAVIGGASHRVASGNQLASEMDGAQRPAWPTALGPQL